MTVFALELFHPIQKLPDISSDIPNHFRLASCKLVSVIHGDADGILYMNDRSLVETLERSNYIICCYPYAVKRMYSLISDKIIGNWWCETNLCLSQGGSCLIVSDKKLSNLVSYKCSWLK